MLFSSSMNFMSFKLFDWFFYIVKKNEAHLLIDCAKVPPPALKGYMVLPTSISSYFLDLYLSLVTSNSHHTR